MADALRPLTKRQHKFIAAYMRLRTASAAAREAGYSPSVANRAAEKVLRHPSVQAEIARIDETLRSETVYTVASMSRAIEGDILDAKKDKQHGAVAQGRTHLSKLHKLIAPETEVYIVDLKAALEAARQRVSPGPRMIDVTPNAEPVARVSPPSATFTAADIFED